MGLTIVRDDEEHKGERKFLNTGNIRVLSQLDKSKEERIIKIRHETLAHVVNIVAPSHHRRTSRPSIRSDRVCQPCQPTTVLHLSDLPKPVTFFVWGAGEYSMP